MDLNKNAKYGHAHKQLRKRLALEIARGGVNCARCGLPIHPREPFDLGHVDGTNQHSGPEHIRCNRQTLTHAKGTHAALELCEHMRAGYRAGKLCCGNSRDW